MYSNINEQSKQTVANQIFLIKSTIYEKQFSPAFNTVLLPSWKSTFFSDYAVLWSFRIGGFLFVLIYIGILLVLSYSIVSILIILNKPIPLHNGNMIQYDKKMVLVFNVLLSLLLVQYTYTFLSNFWVLPVTGQSPGVLCPSYFELAFHLLLINALYYFIDKKIEVEMPDSEKYPIVYTKIKKKTLAFIGGVFILSILPSFAFLRSTAHSTKSSRSVTIILPFDFSCNSCPLLPIRCNARDTLFGEFINITKKIK